MSEKPQGVPGDPDTREERAMKIVLDAMPIGEATGELREALIDLANFTSWDDGVHIMAPWEPRSTLCGHWNRNRVPLEETRPDAVSGCWTCLTAADWFDKQKK